MAESYKFPCGCQLPILDDKINPNTGLPSLDIDFNQLPLDCYETWAAFKEGNTVGVFQLESHLGISWSKNIRPEIIEDISSIISTIRPGVLDTKLDGESMTKVFADRKNKVKPTIPIHESLNDILAVTHHVIVYQEQIMAIAKYLAGFNLVQVDTLRKAVGKKDVEKLNAVGLEFIAGCIKVGIVTEAEAIKIWDNIKAAGRYSFNKSHGVSYALLGYWTMWIKTHFPLHFYTSWLTHAKHRLKPKDEIKKLVSDAKYNGIVVQAPDLSLKPLPAEFAIHNKHIFFGIRDIKKIGDSQLKKLVTELEHAEKEVGKSIDQWTWYEFLIRLSPKLGKTVVHGVISVGGLDFFKLPRRRMLFEYNTFEELTDREKAIISSSACTSLGEALESLLNEKIIEKRLAIIKSLIITVKNPPASLEDSPIWVNKTEQDMLGIPLTHSQNTGEAYDIDTTCREYNDGKKGTMILSTTISNVKENTIKKGPSKGEKMAFLDVEDDSGTMSVVAFSKEWGQYNNILYRGNTVVLTGYRSKQDSFVINKARQI